MDVLKKIRKAKYGDSLYITSKDKQTAVCVLNSFMDFNRDDRDGYFGLNEYSDDYNCEGFYHNFERNPFTDYRFTVSFGFSIKLHPDGHANSFGNPCISFEDAVNGVREYHQVTTESEINGRTVFTIEDEGRVDDHAIYRNYDYIIY